MIGNKLLLIGGVQAVAGKQYVGRWEYYTEDLRIRWMVGPEDI